MRIIAPLRALCLSLLLAVLLSLSISSTWILLGHLPLGDFRGVVFVMAGIVFFCLYAMATYRLIVRFWPLPEGDGGAIVSDGVVISAGAVIGPHAVIGEHAMVKPCSFVKSHTHVPPGETWSGVPAAVESVKTPLESRT